MLKITKLSKIYVFCPAWSATGGVESLHQLIDKLNNTGFQAFAVYIDHKKEIQKHIIVRQEYSSYNIRVTSNVEENLSNIFIFAEVDADLIFRYTNCQRVIYWLSVDNFYWSFRHNLSHLDMLKWDLKYAIKTNLLGKYFHLFIKRDKSKQKTLKISDIRNAEVFHAYQSKYAQNFLFTNKFYYIIELNDYINKNYSVNQTNEYKNKGNAVLYNPKKGMQFTKKLIKRAPHINWIALENLNRTQIVDMLNKNKIYIDFGEHPGRDRLPREAVMNGCCIITGKKGSSSYFEDMPIDSEYKFDNKISEIGKIIKKIELILKDYEIHNRNFDFYRTIAIADEKKLELLIDKILKPLL